MNILKRMNAARSAAVTCSASRHSAEVGERLVEYGKFQLSADPVAAREAGESIAATVAALWEARAEVERLRTDLETAERALDAQTDFRAEIERLRAQVDALQARIDALMLEFCPGEMSEEQLENWARHQRPAPGANLQLGGPVNETPEQTLARLQVAEEIARADAAKNHRMPCVPWRGRDGALGACIYCGKMADAKGDHDGR